MIAHPHHIQEERLFDCYFAERGGELTDPTLADHLADCAECSTRYADLIRFMDGMRAQADAESDAVFTPERLHAQQQQVLRKLEHVACAARVISFPGRFANRPSGSAPRVSATTRWVAAAAVAGLLVGVAVGNLSRPPTLGDARGALSAGLRAPAGASSRTAPVVALGDPVSDPADELFMSDLDVALERPLTRELLPFEALTPHVLEVSNQAR